jgi:uncharacterized membrane protein
MERRLLLLQAAATFYMIGLIWFVQLVHYPLMSQVGVEGYRSYQTAHQNLTSLAVAPAMLLELAAGLALVWLAPRDPWYWGGAVAIGALWASTALVQMPLHAKLALGFNAEAHAALVATNWFRTCLWSGRGVLSLWLIAR